MDDAALERTIRVALRSQSEAVDAVDLWPRVREALPPPHGWRRRLLGRRGAAVLVAAGLLLGASAAVNASGAARSRLGEMVGVRGGGLRGGPAPSVQPGPDFQVLGPGYVPQGLDVQQTSYILGRGPGHSGSIISSYTAGPAAPSPVSSPNPERLAALARDGVPIVYSRYSSNSRPDFVEVVQRRAVPGAALPPGEPAAVGSARASLVEHDGLTTVTLAKSGTLVEVTTNMPRAEAVAVAASLHT